MQHFLCSSCHAAFLVLLARATGAGIVAADLARGAHELLDRRRVMIVRTVRSMHVRVLLMAVIAIGAMNVDGMVMGGGG